MHGPPDISLRESAMRKSACTPGLFLVGFETIIMALLTGLLPLAYGLAVLGCTGLALWHAHLTVMVINFSETFSFHDALRVLSVIGETLASVLLIRQLRTPRVPCTPRMELLQGDQPELFKAIALVAEKVRSPMPAKVVVDSSARLGVEVAGGLRLHLGLCLVVGTSTPQLLGLLAHELAFFSRGSGVGPARFIRGVHRWFVLRIQHDPWMDWLRKVERESPRRLVRWACRFFWVCIWLSLRPLRLLYGVCRVLTGGALRAMACRADACAARLVGSEVMEAAIERQALMLTLCGRINETLGNGTAGVCLPDNLPLLASRRLSIDKVLPDELPFRSHWLDMAPGDDDRMRSVCKMKAEGMLSTGGDATTLFRSFHELARRATWFHYQNTWGLKVNEHRLVAVEEAVHESRASMQTVVALNHHFRGLAHPERAFCGIAEEHKNAERDPEALLMELRDCREWLAQYSERMAAALTEWTKTWRLVRDLQTACMLVRAGLTVNYQQFCVHGNTFAAFQEEIERQRHIMDNMEGVLRQYEGRLETRIACSLDLLRRTPLDEMPPALAQVRQTLPHWVLIYEALGLNLPVLRELMTHFHAFQSLGATVCGVVISPTYVHTVQSAMDPIVRLVADILHTTGQWPYPFRSETGEQGLTLAGYIAPGAAGLNLVELVQSARQSKDGEATVIAQVSARRLSDLVAPLIDRYLTLYHQSFAWVSKASDMAETLLFNPFEEERQRQNIAAARAREAAATMAAPVLPQHDPETSTAFGSLVSRALAA